MLHRNKWCLYNRMTSLLESNTNSVVNLHASLCKFIIRNMNRILGIDHSRIVDLVQVLDISPTIDVWVIGNKWRWISPAAMRDPDCAIDHHF